MKTFKKLQSKEFKYFWGTVYEQQNISLKKDGTIDRRAKPRKGRKALHVSKSGTKRLYIDNVLTIERKAIQ